VTHDADERFGRIANTPRASAGWLKGKFAGLSSNARSGFPSLVFAVAPD
jgi:hypothetical protein